MAALRHGIKTVIIPADNERDLAEIDQTVRGKLNFVVARHVDTVLETALNPLVSSAPELLTHIPEEMKNKAPKALIHQ